MTFAILIEIQNKVSLGPYFKVNSIPTYLSITDYACRCHPMVLVMLFLKEQIWYSQQWFFVDPNQSIEQIKQEPMDLLINFWLFYRRRAPY